MFETATTTLDWLGVIVFTITGVLVASRKEVDFVGSAVLGTVTGIGGGTLRDLLLGAPVFWTREPAYLTTCLLVSGGAFFAAHIRQSRYKFLLWLDALGLALFAVAGSEKALAGRNERRGRRGHGRDHVDRRGHHPRSARRREPGDPQPGDLRLGRAGWGYHLHRPDCLRSAARARGRGRLLVGHARASRVDPFRLGAPAVSSPARPPL